MSRIRKLIIGGLTVSNFFVLAFIFGVFFKGNDSQLYFSVSQTQIDSNKQKLHKCKKEIAKVIDGSRTEYRCRIHARKSHEGAGYTVESLVTVERNDDAGEIEVIIEKDVENPTHHATEATFCEGECSRRGFSETSSNASIMEVIERIAKMAAVMETETEEAVKEAKLKSDTKELDERMKRLEAIKKATKCLGEWNEEEKSFKDFTIEKQVDCEFRKLHSKTSVLEREKYYQETLRGKLWELAMSEELSEEDNGFLTGELLKASVDPYYSDSSRHSIQLLHMYLGWRENYDLLETLTERQRFVGQIRNEANIFASQWLDPRYSKTDMSLLNEGIKVNFSEALAKIRSVSVPSVSDGRVNRKDSVPVNYESVKEGARELYQ